MRTDNGIDEVIARLKGRRLAVCDSCDGQGYTDMGKSACFWCRGAGVTTVQMAHAFGVADRTEAALKAIAEGRTTTFDESERRTVEIWIDEEEMQEIARKALADLATA